MKILFASNSPFVQTGYGQQTAIATSNFTKMGHDVAVFAIFGLEGSKVDWGQIPIYPNNAKDWCKDAPKCYKDFNADLLITLLDVWVLGGMDPTMAWAPWLPVDHEPVPEIVVDVLKKAPGIIKPITMTKFGQRQLLNHGIESYYIPHTVNTELFKPDEDMRNLNRDRWGWQDKFVIGTVGTNHSERKNWNVAFQAVKMFSDKHPGEIVHYAHTDPFCDRGINLALLMKALQLEEVVKFPSAVQMMSGILPETMVAMYNSLDVFLLPSKGEGFGIPLIEAQACGVPIITTKCTGHEELMGGGWFIRNLRRFWEPQNSWQFDCDPEEVAERLEQAYQAKKDGSIKVEQEKAKAKALEYDEAKVYREMWPPVLADLEKRLKQPKNMEGVQPWRLNFIPTTCIPRKVLDVGSGLTVPYKGVLEKLGEYVAVDSRADGNNGIVKADAHDLPFKDKEFGFVWCSELLEHVGAPWKVVEECKRVAEHGVILFSTPMTPSFTIDPDHKTVDAQKVPHTVLSTGDGLIAF